MEVKAGIEKIKQHIDFSCPGHIMTSTNQGMSKRFPRKVATMHPMPSLCPVCGDRLEVTRLHCRSCDTTIEGYFEPGRIFRLSPEQLAFVETFIRCEGRLNRMERRSLSHPTSAFLQPG